MRFPILNSSPTRTRIRNVGVENRSDIQFHYGAIVLGTVIETVFSDRKSDILTIR